MFKMINGKVLKDKEIWEKINNSFLYKPTEEEQTFIDECFEMFARDIDIQITICRCKEEKVASYRNLVELAIRYYKDNERSYDLYMKMKKFWRR